MTLAEQLGYSTADRLLILNADDYGMCRSANLGITSLLAGGGISSTTVMMPCGWAPNAVATAIANPSFDVGIHLTFTSEWTNYRWGPITTAESASLVDEFGYFPSGIAPVEVRANDDEVRRESRAQIDRAIGLGLAPTHADNHMGSLYGLATGRDFLETVLTLCAEYGLPFRLPRYSDGLSDDPETAAALARRCLEQAEKADRLGVIIPDYLWTRPFHLAAEETYESVKAEWIEMIASIPTGVTEVYMHPFVESDEIRDLSADWRKRVFELRLFNDPDMRSLIADSDITLIGWRELQTLQKGLNS